MVCCRPSLSGLRLTRKLWAELFVNWRAGVPQIFDTTVETRG